MGYAINNLPSDNQTSIRKDIIFIVFASAAVIASAFHFWPLGDNKLWQILNVTNLCCMAALGMTGLMAISGKYRKNVLALAPHISVVAYLIINILSIAIADSLNRPLTYTAKTVLIFLGGFWLFQTALFSTKIFRLFYGLIAVTVSLSIVSCLFVRLGDNPTSFGFHDNVFKYGTYIGILVPLAGVYLLYGRNFQVSWGILIIATGIFSAGSAGACLAIISGLTTGFLVTRKPIMRKRILIALLFSGIAFWVSNQLFNWSTLSDFYLKENDHTHLRQRYIEWQAELNLLEKRGITGTGAGCVNDYRSKYYYRLPKLNTLKTFDQNGFLAVAAETGILGFVMFVWILLHYGRMCFKSQWYVKMKDKADVPAMITANAAAFVATLAANIFSSVHYNGNLIIFVFLLSLIASVNRLYGENMNEN